MTVYGELLPGMRQDEGRACAPGALGGLAERDGINKVFTLDHRDFGVYRPAKLGRFFIIP